MQLAGMAGGAPDGAEVALRGRVEVDHHAVRLPGAVGAGEPDVRRDRVLADEVHERLGVAGDTCVTVPRAFGTSTRRIQPGK